MILGKEAYAFIVDLPGMYDTFMDGVQRIPDFLKSVQLLPDAMQINMDKMIGYVENVLLTVVNRIGSTGVNHAGSIAVNVANFLIGVIVSILSAYFFVVYREKMSSGYERFLPEEAREGLQEILFHIKNAIGGYAVALLIAIIDVIPFLGTGFVLIPWALYDFASGNYFLMTLRLILYVICLLSRQLL